MNFKHFIVKEETTENGKKYTKEQLMTLDEAVPMEVAKKKLENEYSYSRRSIVDRGIREDMVEEYIKENPNNREEKECCSSVNEHLTSTHTPTFKDFITK